MVSISSRMSSIILIEYGLPLILSNNFFIEEKLLSSKSLGSFRSSSPK